MANENYNIDDILSEIKKRREENTNEILNRQDPEPPKPSIQETNPIAEPVLEPEDVPVVEPIIDTEPAAPPIEVPNLELEQEKEQEADDGMVDLFALNKVEAEEIPEPEPKLSDKKLEAEEIDEDDTDTKKKKKAKKDKKGKDGKKKKNPLKTIIIILLVLIVLVVAGGGAYLYYALNMVTEPEQTQSNPELKEKEWDGMDELVEVFNPIEETDASQLASLQDMIKTWYYNGEPSSSTHVLNILLIGEDTRGSDILDTGTRADSAMIASINIDTKTIQLTSILRDTYAYWENEPGNADSGTWNKINAAMALGDIEVYKNAVERLYKVQIDNHIIVNFDSFEAIIDAMGGVTLELTTAEINEINNHPKRYNKVYIEKSFDGDKGKLKLNGKQALAYCRIRKLDSDNMRANRQKICISEVAKEARDVSPSTLIKMVNKLLPYVKTDMKKSNILKIGKYALKQGWLDYDMVTTNMPEYRIGESGSGGVFNFAGGWIWKCDFPHDAYTLQTMIYGKSPITLARTRVDYINCNETGYYSEGAPATWAVIQNENYGQVTTLTTTTKESEE